MLFLCKNTAGYCSQIGCECRFLLTCFLLFGCLLFFSSSSLGIIHTALPFLVLFWVSVHMNESFKSLDHYWSCFLHLLRLHSRFPSKVKRSGGVGFWSGDCPQTIRSRGRKQPLTQTCSLMRTRRVKSVCVCVCVCVCVFT